MTHSNKKNGITLKNSSVCEEAFKQFTVHHNYTGDRSRKTVGTSSRVTTGVKLLPPMVRTLGSDNFVGHEYCRRLASSLTRSYSQRYAAEANAVTICCMFVSKCANKPRVSTESNYGVKETIARRYWMATSSSKPINPTTQIVERVGAIWWLHNASVKHTNLAYKAKIRKVNISTVSVDVKEKLIFTGKLYSRFFLLIVTKTHCESFDQFELAPSVCPLNTISARTEDLVSRMRYFDLDRIQRILSSTTQFTPTNLGLTGFSNEHKGKKPTCFVGYFPFLSRSPVIRT
ncbi:hypothetical protein CLF_103561 [Clonorchis sinensis]|uniref:Uncharacterized protein n=1 Tax=Clonorchis sinensis TaxID=79923 RepID=G7YNJ7_CLOSI|nr:hypothetical protein CLF_103561 [Clonorchis sinensis]